MIKSFRDKILKMYSYADVFPSIHMIFNAEHR